MTSPAERQARLAAALRANLRKRKVQARGRQDARPESADQPPEAADGRSTPEEARPATRKAP